MFFFIILEGKCESSVMTFGVHSPSLIQTHFFTFYFKTKRINALQLCRAVLSLIKHTNMHKITSYDSAQQRNAIGG
jgi:hypothetical protein